MRNDAPIKEYNYTGALAKICGDFIAEKRAVGYSYAAEAKMLYSFSRFTIDFASPVNTLTFTSKEIMRFFEQADALKQKPKSTSPRRHIIMPVIFRMLYCCGLRVSEATELRGEDVDLLRGILLIRKSKFAKTRYVPMSEELTSMCVKYNETRLVGSGDYDWFFAAPDGGHYDSRSIYSVFRELLWNAGISHGGTGKGPRVHDFRHTFAVHCLQKWVEQGADPTTVLPRLSTYLGHNGLDSTEGYLRMTAEVYPEISALMEREYGYIIPKFGGTPHEIT